MLVPIVIVHPGKVQGKRKSFWKSFWGCVVMLQETCQLLHLCIEHDVFRHTSYTVFSRTCLLLLCPPVLEDGTCGGVMSPCDLEGSSPLVLSKSPLNRGTKYCLEHLMTSDWQVFPPPGCHPWFLDGRLSCRLPLGWSACSQMPQAWPWCCPQYLPPLFLWGMLIKRVLGLGTIATFV